MITISSDRLSAVINPFGAELTHLRDGEGRELMTDADPAFWTGHAPLLFPIVGRLNGDRYRLDGREWEMPKHGFARRLPFQLVEAREDGARFRLTDSEATRPHYPFAFALDAQFGIVEATLTMSVTVTNRDERPMPASFGFHPAFAWPLPYGRPREAHRIRFEREEPGALRSITPGGLIAPEPRESPVEGDTLVLRDELFAHDALVWEKVASRSLVYGAAEGPRLRIDYPDTDRLGIWTRPGAAFVCIEPWHGIADPEGFTGDIWNKPGILRFEPGEARSFVMRVALEN